MVDPSLHTAQITSFEHKEESKELLLKAKLPTGERYQVIFENIVWWELCSFGLQNVLFCIKPYDHQSLTDAIINDQDIAEQYVNMIRDGSHTLFVLDASVGVTGWIIATKMTIEPIA